MFLQKEPKLARAKHIPEWETYDDEVARFTRELATKGVISSGMAAADSKVLAEAGAGKPIQETDEKNGEDIPLPSGSPSEEHVRTKDEL